MLFIKMLFLLVFPWYGPPLMISASPLQASTRTQFVSPGYQSVLISTDSVPALEGSTKLPKRATRRNKQIISLFAGDDNTCEWGKVRRVEKLSQWSFLA
jgi:hypothetical protein